MNLRQMAGKPVVWSAFLVFVTVYLRLRIIRIYSRAFSQQMQCQLQAAKPLTFRPVAIDVPIRSQLFSISMNKEGFWYGFRHRFARPRLAPISVR